METRDLLRKTVADFFEVDVGQVGPTFPLTGRIVQSSIDRAALASRIRHQVGLNSKAVYTAATYEELEAGLIPGVAQSVPASMGSPTATLNDRATRVTTRSVRPAEPAPDGRPASCGIDMELIERFPSVADYWEDPFYKTCFTPAEIAYCLMQEAPAHHFAARWCAKEALKKCDPDLFSEEMKNLEVVSGDSQEPLLNHYVGGELRRLPHSVSISHTPLAAIAVVIRVGSGSAQPDFSPGTVTSVSDPPREAEEPPLSSSSRLLGILPTLFALVALCLAVFALLRTYHVG
jgi:phosphopantetheine--protein transferase-like protein